MKKDSRVNLVVGLDVSDKWTRVCVVSMDSGEVLEEGRIRTSKRAVRERFAGRGTLRVVLEVGTHSPWMSRLLEELGHEVIVANASKVALIYANSRKRDRADAENLARLGRSDPKLLHGICHRSQSAQEDLAVIRSRDQLVRCRTQLITHVRGSVKAMGGRLPSCGAECFARRVAGEIPPGLAPALEPILEQIAALTQAIRVADRRLEQLAQRYGVTELLLPIRGVGALTALTYVLVLEDPTRFATSRSVGAYLGYARRLNDSGDSSPQLRISKQGDELLRRLLVHCAHYILGPFGEDCDLRRFGNRIAGRGGSFAKKKAVVAVARKLAVLLHHLWVTGEVYDPFHTARRNGEAPQEDAA